jgi:hypothetical protein
VPLVGFGLPHDLPLGPAAVADANSADSTINVAALRANDFMVIMKGSEKSDRELDGRVHFSNFAFPRSTTNIYVFLVFTTSQL